MNSQIQQGPFKWGRAIGIVVGCIIGLTVVAALPLLLTLSTGVKPQLGILRSAQMAGFLAGSILFCGLAAWKAQRHPMLHGAFVIGVLIATMIPDILDGAGAQTDYVLMLLVGWLIGGKTVAKRRAAQATLA